MVLELLIWLSVDFVVLDLFMFICINCWCECVGFKLIFEEICMFDFVEMFGVGLFKVGFGCVICVGE